tara:strand:- start:75 stop:662 length:588 start_codon:yes stop_codon:yes gene_type:complete
MYKNFLNKCINENINLKKDLLVLFPELKKAALKIFFAIKKSRKILICGNGGSAADAQHLAAEFLVRLRPNINRKPLPIITLGQDTSTITACSNDYSFEKLFSRNLEALYKKGDILITISTSGMSKNIIHVLNYAKKNNIFSISLLGNKGGKAQNLTNIPIVVPSKNVARIQECHIFIGHIILEWVENELIKKKII